MCFGGKIEKIGNVGRFYTLNMVPYQFLYTYIKTLNAPGECWSIWGHYVEHARACPGPLKIVFYLIYEMHYNFIFATKSNHKLSEVGACSIRLIGHLTCLFMRI